MINKKGQSLLEVVLAIAIFGLLCSSLVTMSLGGFTSLQQGGEYVEAEAYAQQGIEAVRAIQGSAWNKLTVTSTAVTSTGNAWSFVGENTSSTLGKYSRTIIFANVCRDVSNNLVTCPGSYTDLNTKQATVTVTWLSTRNAINTVQKFTFLTNWNSRDWTQTDWSGGTGQSVWSLTNKYNTDDGNVDKATSGEIKLVNSGFNCGIKKWTFDTATDYTYDSAKIEVLSSLAQLKNITTTTYPSDSPTVNPSNAHLVSSIDNWSGFSEVATKNGGEVYYQLSDNGGSTWKYWSGSAWSTSTLATNYNVASVINTNISTFATSSKQVMFKAFLVGNGSQQVQLDQVQVNCSRKYNWDFSTPASYTYNSSLIDVTSSLAQLKDLGGASVCSGAATVCSAFSSSPTCAAQGGCSWSSATTASTTNSGFTLNANGWTYADWEDSNNKATGAWQAASGNPTGYVRITTGGQKNLTISGFYYQAFTTTQNNATGTLSYDWKVITYNAQNLVSYRIYVFIDTIVGAPTIGTEVASTTIVGTTAWASRLNINISSKLATAGTYYVKFAVQEILNNAAGTPGNSQVGFDNAIVTFTNPSSCSGTPTACNTYIASSTCSAQVGCSWSGGAGTSYSTTSPSINPTASFSVSTSTFDGWTDFAEVASTTGGTVSYQLSGDGGSTWNYWNGGAWATAGAGNYNNSSTINSNIITFPTSTGQIMFKAFLTSNGSQQIALDNVSVGWGQSAGGGYATAGTFLSSAFNMTKSSPVQILAWDQNVTGCNTCNIQIQIRTAPNNAGSPGTWSGWYGANGTSTYFTNYLGTLLPTVLNGNQWVQYQANLAGDGSGTPILQEVRVNYK